MPESKVEIATLLVTGGCGLLSLLMIFVDIVALPILLTSTSCLSYRSYEGGAGDINYCILYPEDDELKVSFDLSSENVDRTDSTVYLLPSPIKMRREPTTVSQSFEDKDFKRYHYLFKDDTITGTVKCKGECTVTVVQVDNSCMKEWNNTVFDLNNVQRKSSSNKCKYHNNVIATESTQDGEFSFVATALSESPTFVRVDKGLFSSPTGTIVYTVHHTVFDLSKAILKCNSYKCLFDGLTGAGRTETYVAVNVFSDKMTGTYELEMYYHPSKEAMTDASIGLGITLGVCLFFTAIGAVAHLLYKHYEESSSSSSSSNNSAPLFTESEAEMQNPEYCDTSATIGGTVGSSDVPTPGDDKVAQPTTGNEETTPSGEPEEPKEEPKEEAEEPKEEAEEPKEEPDNATE